MCSWTTLNINAGIIAQNYSSKNSYFAKSTKPSTIFSLFDVAISTTDFYVQLFMRVLPEL